MLLGDVVARFCGMNIIIPSRDADDVVTHPRRVHAGNTVKVQLNDCDIKAFFVTTTRR